MSPTQKKTTRNKRPVGRPRVDATAINLRLTPSLLSAVDKWVRREGFVSRQAGIKAALQRQCET
jgi:hypothetical protein